MTTVPAARTRSGPLPGLVALVRLDLRRAFRNRRYLLFTVGFPAAFYLLYTGVLMGRNSGDERIDGIPWSIYFMASMAAYGAMAAALGGSRAIATDRSSGWIGQLRVTPLDPSAYVVGRLVVSLVTTIPAIVLVALVGFAAHGIDLGPGEWAELVVGLGLGSLPFAALGILVGYLLDGDSAQGGMMVLLFGLAILGGLWAPVATFSATLSTIAHMLPSYHFADLGWRTVAGHAPDSGDILVLAAYTAAFGTLVAWRYRIDGRRAGR